MYNFTVTPLNQRSQIQALKSTVVHPQTQPMLDPTVAQYIIVFIEKHPHTSGPLQFKPTLLKAQLCVCACMHMSVRACTCVRMRACVCVRACMCVCVPILLVLLLWRTPACTAAGLGRKLRPVSRPSVDEPSCAPWGERHHSAKNQGQSSGLSTV